MVDIANEKNKIKYFDDPYGLSSDFDKEQDAVDVKNSDKTSPCIDNMNPDVIYEDVDFKRLVQDMKSRSAISCFGGILFRTSNRYDLPLVAFAVKDLSSDLLQNHLQWYNFLKGNMIKPFLSFNRYYRVNDYIVFTFDIGKGFMSLRQKIAENDSFSDSGDVVFAQLINHLDYYRKVYLTSEYDALCSLSLDTVFVNNIGDETEVSILPLRVVDKQYPPHYPGEVYYDNCDLSTDMYCAALVATEVLSYANTKEVDCVMSQCRVLPCIGTCLSIYKSWRPGINEVIAEIKASKINMNLKPSASLSADGKIYVKEKKEREIESVISKFNLPKLPLAAYFKNMLAYFRSFMKNIGLESPIGREPESEKRGTVSGVRIPRQDNKSKRHKHINTDKYE